MDCRLSQNWWALVIRGFAGVIFGILALIWPGITFLVLALLFGAYAFVDGVFSIAAAVANHHEARNWWALLIEGIIGVVVGVLTFFWPGITGLVLLYLIAGWALATGVFEIITAVRLRHYIEGEWALALAGALSVIFGILVAIAPAAGIVAVVWMIAVYSILFGVLLAILGFQLRSWCLPAGGSGRLAGRGA